LTPGNAGDLLFDDVLWVQEAQKDHYDFVLKMRERGVEVLDLHELLAETLKDKEARLVPTAASPPTTWGGPPLLRPGPTRCRRRSSRST
jgi:hypothetical protein